MPIYEFCAENVTLLEKAFKAGAQRVELCDLPITFCLLTVPKRIEAQHIATSQITPKSPTTR